MKMKRDRREQTNMYVHMVLLVTSTSTYVRSYIYTCSVLKSSQVSMVIHTGLFLPAPYLGCIDGSPDGFSVTSLLKLPF